MDKPKILLVDDELNICESFVKEFRGKGYDINYVTKGYDALEKVKIKDYDIVLLDLVLPDVHGLNIMEEIKSGNLFTEVIVLTGFATVQNAIEAMKKGAYDFITKPYDIDELEQLILKAFEKIKLKKKNYILNLEIDRVKPDEFTFVGRSDSVKEIFDIVDTIAKTDTTVLIEGESGTGKEIIANYVHKNSRRRTGSFVVVNCSTFSDSLFGSELFGHVRGAFTGALKDKIGIIQVADRGTLFLDEIGDMPLNIQTQLLRVVETGKFRKVGGTNELSSDVRIICATNKDIESLVRDGKFREDLFFRLNVVRIKIPPLRERREDIPLIVDYYLEYFSKLYKTPKPVLQKEAKDILFSYDWPGNVRELKNVLELLFITCKDRGFIDKENLPLYIVSDRRTKDYSDNMGSLKDMEKLHIMKTLEKNNWNKLKTAKMLGINPSTLYEKLKKYKIEP